MESSNCGHSDNRLLKEIDHSGCLALYSFNILDTISVMTKTMVQIALNSD